MNGVINMALNVVVLETKLTDKERQRRISYITEELIKIAQRVESKKKSQEKKSA